MTLIELDNLLRQWGALSKYTAEHRDAGDSHVLHRNRDFAPGTRERAARQIMGRDGYSRRRYMASGLAECGISVLPMDYVDPVPCKQTNRGGHSPDRKHIPAALLPVHNAASELHRIDTLMGLCLRYEYCGYGSQSDKAGYVAGVIGSPVGLRVYREALARAKGWVMGRLAKSI